MAEDTMFMEAVEALRSGDRARAKDLLTRLLKADQNSVTYWIWLSAAVETTKERIYCLQTALKLDPENTTAKRGLVLLGALPPDETVRPFPLNRPRAWEEKLLLAHERPKPRGIKAVSSSPTARLAGLGVLGVIVCGLAIFGMMLPRNIFFRAPNTNTAGPSPTFTLTPTLVNAITGGLPTNIGQTPLSALLPVPYTPTPLYVNTPRSPLSQDTFRAAKAAYAQGDWETFIRTMRDIARSEPDAADIPFYIGEAYRFQGDYNKALVSYNDALKIDSNFGPAYLGLARARLGSDPNADVTQLFDAALQADPNFGETYLERASYYLYHNDPASALTDLEAAADRMPNSALVQLGFARAYLMDGNTAKALEAAKKANEIDLTLLSSYYYLGQAYIEQEEYKNAIAPLQTYAAYATKDGSGYALLGEAYAEAGMYQPAVDSLSRALSLDPSQRQSYLYRGLSNLELENIDAAEYDFKKALEFFPSSFDASLGLTRAYFAQEHFGDAYLQIEATNSKAKTNEQRALALYWRALIQEKRGQPRLAAKDWQALLDLPESAMTAQMRNDALQHLKAIITPTSTPKPGGTRTPTRTPTKTPMPTKTP